jgi:hypothetical protein
MEIREPSAPTAVVTRHLDLGRTRRRAQRPRVHWPRWGRRRLPLVDEAPPPDWSAEERVPPGAL